MMLMTTKTTAADNPILSGIFFYPALLPFLLISRPKMFLLSMRCLKVGMRALVSR